MLGYNGIGRITGNNGGGGPGGGARPGGFRGGFGGGGGGNAIDQFGGEPGIARLFNNGMGDQVMWLAPVAAAALVGGLALAARRRLRPGETGALIMWGGWAASTYVVFAFAEGIYHNYYVAALAPAVAALVGIGVALVRRHRGGTAAAIAVVALATAWLQRVFLERVDAYEWLRVAVPFGLVVVAALAVASLALPAWRSRAVPWLAGAALGVALLPGRGLDLERHPVTPGRHLPRRPPRPGRHRRLPRQLPTGRRADSWANRWRADRWRAGRDRTWPHRRGGAGR